MSSEKRTSRQDFVQRNRDILVNRAKQGMKTLIVYVRDRWGYRKGAVVALSPTQIGWSLVHQSKDTGLRAVTAESLPIYQQLTRRANRLVESGDYKTAFAVQGELVKAMTEFAKGDVGVGIPGYIRIPFWDREKGLHNAFRSAEENGGDSSYIKTDFKTKPEPGDILDADVVATLHRVYARVEQFFSAKPKSDQSSVRAS